MVSTEHRLAMLGNVVSSEAEARKGRYLALGDNKNSGTLNGVFFI